MSGMESLAVTIAAILLAIGIITGLAVGRWLYGETAYRKLSASLTAEHIRLAEDRRRWESEIETLKRRIIQLDDSLQTASARASQVMHLERELEAAKGRERAVRGQLREREAASRKPGVTRTEPDSWREQL